MPEVVTLYFSLMWAAAPFWLLLYFLIPLENIAPIARMSKNKWIKLPLFAFFAPCLVWYAWCFPIGDLSMEAGVVQEMLKSRLMLALIGPLMPGGATLGVFILATWVRRINTLYLKP
jgi:hypothetical protein